MYLFIIFRDALYSVTYSYSLMYTESMYVKIFLFFFSSIREKAISDFHSHHNYIHKLKFFFYV